jgi:transcriptional activator SPT7
MIVIKKPMDLGTMAKKLKELKYRSKQEFADDLAQIYKNCFEYNTEPVSDHHCREV